MNYYKYSATLTFLSMGARMLTVVNLKQQTQKEGKMRKTRFLLLLVIMAFGVGHWLLRDDNHYIEYAFFSSFPMISNFLLLLFSFFEVDKTPEGEICFKRSNPYLRLMRCVFSESKKLKTGSISICALHLHSLLLVVFGIIAALICYVISIFMFLLFSGELSFNQISLQKFLHLLAVTGPLILIAGLAMCKNKILKKLGGFLCFAYIGILLFIFLVYLPITSLMFEYSYAFIKAILIYLAAIVIMISALIGVFFSVIFALKHLPALRETWLAQILFSVKNNICPMVRLEVQE